MNRVSAYLILVGLAALVGCGGGGGSGSSATSAMHSASSSSSSSSSGGSSSGSSSGSTANVVAVTVNSGPPAAHGGTFNIPYASVTVCIAGTSTCATIANVLVDTGSSGLRLMASALQAAGLNLPSEADPANANNTLAECLPFADGYTWGPLANVDVMMAGETAHGISINIIDDRHTFTAAPSGCASSGMNMSLNSVSAFDANGVLGVGTFDQDCGPSCAICASFSGGCTTRYDIYYSCANTGNQCNLAQVAVNSQVRNPVTQFAVDNNGVILQLPSVPTAGQTTASGTLTFGIGTQTDNALGSAKVLTADSAGNIITLYKSQTLSDSFFDSGSNGLYFPDSSIPACTNSQSNPSASDFYCPTTLQQLQATNQGQDGTQSVVSFEVSNLNSISNSFYAVPSIGGPAATNTMLGSYFDWGVPFFYGRSVYTAIEGKSAAGTMGPYYAY
ncbi:MAG TPA: DUF3443 domain-containing protein [Steroidobacteraceae bacterium]|jgi:hypothetical protein